MMKLAIILLLALSCRSHAVPSHNLELPGADADRHPFTAASPTRTFLHVRPLIDGKVVWPVNHINKITTWDDYEIEENDDITDHTEGVDIHALHEWPGPPCRPVIIGEIIQAVVHSVELGTSSALAHFRQCGWPSRSRPAPQLLSMLQALTVALAHLHVHGSIYGGFFFWP